MPFGLTPEEQKGLLYGSLIKAVLTGATLAGSGRGDIGTGVVSGVASGLNTFGEGMNSLLNYKGLIETERRREEDEARARQLLSIQQSREARAQELQQPQIEEIKARTAKLQTPQAPASAYKVGQFVTRYRGGIPFQAQVLGYENGLPVFGNEQRILTANERAFPELSGINPNEVLGDENNRRISFPQQPQPGILGRAYGGVKQFARDINEVASSPTAGKVSNIPTPSLPVEDLSGLSKQLVAVGATRPEMGLIFRAVGQRKVAVPRLQGWLSGGASVKEILETLAAKEIKSVTGHNVSLGSNAPLQ